MAGALDVRTLILHCKSKANTSCGKGMAEECAMKSYHMIPIFSSKCKMSKFSNFVVAISFCWLITLKADLWNRLLHSSFPALAAPRRYQIAMRRPSK